MNKNYDFLEVLKQELEETQVSIQGDSYVISNKAKQLGEPVVLEMVIKMERQETKERLLEHLLEIEKKLVK